MKKHIYKEFDGTLLLVGFGAVAQCTLPLILKHIQCDLKKIIIIDPVRPDIMAEYEAQGIRFFQEKITPENLSTTLHKYVKSGDIIIDLAVDIDCCAILQWCHDNNVRYVNTSVELWDPYDTTCEPTKRTLYPRHMALRALKKSWKKVGPSMVVEHGANPGLVSHFTKKALVDIADTLLKKNSNDSRKKQIEEYMQDKNYPALAQLLGVKTIHISERDTQVASLPRAVNEFVNTWSIDGFHEEGIAPAEMGWGTHEKELPANAYEHTMGPKNQICLAQMGIQTWARSTVPSGPIIGMIVRHGESFTISDYLTIWENDSALYRPTVHYVYCPTDATLNSLHEFKAHNLVMQSKKRIMRDEIISGTDEVGVLLMGHDFKSWWTGSVLSIEEARTLAPGQNATTLQVACSVLAAVVWMLKNPEKGLCVPDDLPYEDVLEVAAPYLGDLVSRAIDWTPLDNRKDLFTGWDGKECCDYDDPWQFKNFRVTRL